MSFCSLADTAPASWTGSVSGHGGEAFRTVTAAIASACRGRRMDVRWEMGDRRGKEREGERERGEGDAPADGYRALLRFGEPDCLAGARSRVCGRRRSYGCVGERCSAGACFLRSRIGPLKSKGSTAEPFCVISKSPSTHSSRAAARMGSRSSLQSLLESLRATSDGHALEVAARASSSVRMASR